MNTQQLFKTAYSASRLAVRDNQTSQVYESPLGAAMRSTYGQQTLWRFKVTTAAAAAAEMNRSYRVRASVRLVHSNRLAWKLLAYRVKKG